MLARPSLFGNYGGALNLGSGQASGITSVWEPRAWVGLSKSPSQTDDTLHPEDLIARAQPITSTSGLTATRVLLQLQ